MLELLLRSFFKEGALIVRLPRGRVAAIGGADETTAPLILAVVDEATERAIIRNPLLRVGEAYMDGRILIERGSVYDFMHLITRNFWRWKPKYGPFTWLLERLGQINDRVTARLNVARHYDLSGELFDLFLDEDRQYSCAYFPEPGISLEQAQIAKKRHLAAKLLLKPDCKVLDIGSGWGGLALTLAEEYGADVTGITLSAEQFKTACDRAAQKNLQSRVHFEMRDYRDVHETFDRIVSVGMFEHVGKLNYQKYFDAIAGALAEDGVAVIHTIGNISGFSGTNAWIQKYIFPGGCIPALSDIVPVIERAGLMIADVEVLRHHYADTLHAWSERFAVRRDEARALYDERFCRMWEFYLAVSEASFRAGANVVFQLQLTKRNDVIPITREYITDFDRGRRSDSAGAAAAE
jgi:cyclopropane-fatty-acyl-phospholipid synthase